MTSDSDISLLCTLRWPCVWKGLPGLWRPAQEEPRLAPLLASSSAPLPLCPVAINWGGSVYFGYRECAVQPTAATPFLDLLRLTFELCCSQSCSIYQMGETFRQLYKLQCSFFGSATATVLCPLRGGRGKKHSYSVNPTGRHRAPLQGWTWTRWAF